jgi:hypothetical protein
MVVVQVHRYHLLRLLPQKGYSQQAGCASDPKSGELTDVAMIKAIPRLCNAVRIGKSFNAEQIIALLQLIAVHETTWT